MRHAEPVAGRWLVLEGEPTRLRVWSTSRRWARAAGASTARRRPATCAPSPWAACACARGRSRGRPVARGRRAGAARRGRARADRGHRGGDRAVAAGRLVAVHADGREVRAEAGGRLDLAGLAAEDRWRLGSRPSAASGCAWRAATTGCPASGESWPIRPSRRAGARRGCASTPTTASTSRRGRPGRRHRCPRRPRPVACRSSAGSSAARRSPCTGWPSPRSAACRHRGAARATAPAAADRALDAYAMGGTVRAVFTLAAQLATGREVEVISVNRRRERPYFPFPPGVRSRALDDRARRAAGRARAGRAAQRARPPRGLRLSVRAACGRTCAAAPDARERGEVVIGTRPAWGLLAAAAAPPDAVTVGAGAHAHPRAPPGAAADVRRRYRGLDALAVLTHGRPARLPRRAGRRATRIEQIPNAVPPAGRRPRGARRRSSSPPAA